MSSKKMFILSLLITVAVGLFCFTNFVWAEDYGLSATAGAAGLDKTLSGSLPSIVGNLLGTALSFIGVLFFALMVFGGFMWMTARGNEEQTKKALNTITAAVIGLVIVLSSYTITSFVFKSVGVQEGGSVASGGGADSGETSPCAEYGTGWTCNTLDKCSAITTTVAPVDLADEKKVIAECSKVGTESCQYIKDKCPKAASNFQVCCKPKDASQEKTRWCFDTTFKGCVRISAVGEDACKTGTRYYFVTTPKSESHDPTKAAEMTEIDCLKQELKDAQCGEKPEICNTSKTGYVCNSVSKTCIEAKDSQECSTNKDCPSDKICKIPEKTTKGTCAKGKACESGTSEGTVGSFNNCSWSACGTGGDVCETDSQCEVAISGGKSHCVADKNGTKYCVKGDSCSVCRKDSDCNADFFCDLDGRTTAGFDTGCHAKVGKGEKCFGNNSACAGGMKCVITTIKETSTCQ